MSLASRIVGGAVGRALGGADKGADGAPVGDPVSAVVHADTRGNVTTTDLGALPDRLAALGFEAADAARMRRRLAQPLGLVVVGGPRGGGVTTTLRALRAAVPPPPDDPAGPDGGTAPPALLLDPVAEDVVPAVLASIVQGRRILCGLYLERAAHLFAQWRALGIAPDFLARQLLFVVAQCRVRRLCPACRCPDPSDAPRHALARATNSWLTEPATVYTARAGGCPKCAGTGHQGWALAYELLDLDAGARVLVEGGTLGLELEQALFADGRSLWDHGLRLLARGNCSLAALQQAIREPF